MVSTSTGCPKNFGLKPFLGILDQVFLGVTNISKTSKPDGPSLESCSMFVFECGFEISWSLGPLDPWTLGLLELFPPPTSNTSSYILLPPPVSSSYSPPLVWFGMVLVWYGMVWHGGGVEL